MIKKIKELDLRSKIQLLITQIGAMIISTSVMFCSSTATGGVNIFAKANDKLSSYVDDGFNLAITCIIIAGFISAIFYALSKNERNSENAWKWFLRCVGALFLVLLIKSANHGLLYDLVADLLS